MSGQHRHKCATKGCPHYYVCTQRDCRLEWLCPRCEDNERFDELTRYELLTHATTPTQEL